jgi:hypothetical protein
MRFALLAFAFACALVACRTRPFDAPADGAPDLATSDLAVTPDAGACVISCAPGELCVFLNRGDCSRWACAASPPACPSHACSCLGAHFCDQFEMGADESYTCQAPDPGLGGDVECVSSIQCV